MMHSLKKTAVIGLGGTGMHAVLYMKRKLLNTYGEVPPMIKFLVIDTTDADPLTTPEGDVVLEPGEFLKLEVKDPGSLIATNREVKEWLPERVPRFALTSGAKQVRALGRLAVFANATELNTKIRGLLSSVRDFRISRSERYEVLTDNVVVNVVCSISGGTGSGCLLDVGVLTRMELRSTDRMIGYFLLPDIFLGKPAVDNVEPNAYGALKEVNYFFDGGKYRYTLGGVTRSIDGELFNAVYLVNKTNKDGIEFSNDRDLKEFLGVGMFLQATSTGKGASDVVDNVEAQMVGKRWFNKPTVYSSFGISELVYPGDWYANLYAHKIALQTLQSTFLGGDLSGVGKFTDDFVRRAGLREHDADDVIEAIGDPAALRQFSLPKEFKKSEIAPALARRDGHLSQVQRDVRDTCLAELAKLKELKSEALRKEILGRLAVPQGLEFTRTFLSGLTGRLRQYGDELAAERERFERERSELPSRFKNIQADAEDAGKGLFGITSASKIETSLRALKRHVDREARVALEVERRERAIDLFAHLVNQAEEWQARLSALSSYALALTQELSQDIERIQFARREVKPFVEQLKPADLADDIQSAGPHDFLEWLKDTKASDVLALAGLRVGEVKQVLLEYGNADKKVRDVKNKSIDQILRGLPPKQVMKYITRLDAMAAPLWQYDKGQISGDKNTANIYLFGVEDRDNTVVVPEEVTSALGSVYPPSVISTGDSKRIVCFKVEASVPAHVVSNMPRYREKYSDPNKPFPYHIHRDWERDLPDLFPGTDEQDARKYWSLGLAEPFNLIVKRGEYYYIHSERRGERTLDYLVKLGQGRREAQKAFVADSELVAEAKETIDRINGELGNKQVSESLLGYGQKLGSEASKQKEEIRKSVELELKDIDTYIKSLSSL